MDTVKVALTGAAGQIGYHLAFLIAKGEVFGEVPVELVMVDIPSTLDAMVGLKMELEDSALEHISNINE